MRYPFDQACRADRSLRQPASARAISSAVGLVVHAEQVQHAVQHQDPDLLLERVAVLRA